MSKKIKLKRLLIKHSKTIQLKFLKNFRKIVNRFQFKLKRRFKTPGLIKLKEINPRRKLIKKFLIFVKKIIKIDSLKESEMLNKKNSKTRVS